MAKKSSKKKDWIADAIKNPGALHKKLNVPQGQSIPADKLEKASQSDNPTTKRQANLAKTLKKINRKRKKKK